MQEESDSNTTKTIFLIEEDDDARPHLKKNLRDIGYRVLAAADLEDALEWASVTPIPADPVLINMIGAGVEEALSAGRENSLTCKIRWPHASRSSAGEDSRRVGWQGREC